MSLQAKHKPKRGMWFQDGKSFFWKEFIDQFGQNYELYKPTDLVDISRLAEFDIIFIREYPDINSFNGKISCFFKQKCKMKIREDATENIVLKFGDDKRYYLMDISALGRCMQAPLESTEVFTVEMDDPVKIDQKEAQDIMKVSGYAFGKINTDASGRIIDYVTTV